MKKKNERKDNRLLYCLLNALFVMSLLFFVNFGVYAQTNLKGKVTDNKGEPLIGVNVVEKETRQGTITDIDGEFSLSVSTQDAIIEFSYVGFKTVEIPLNGRTLLNLTLTEDTELLDEVVVVGYGVQKRVHMTGAVSQISSKELTSAPMQNVSNMLTT